MGCIVCPQLASLHGLPSGLLEHEGCADRWCLERVTWKQIVTGKPWKPSSVRLVTWSGFNNILPWCNSKTSDTQPCLHILLQSNEVVPIAAATPTALPAWGLPGGWVCTVGASWQAWCWHQRRAHYLCGAHFTKSHPFFPTEGFFFWSTLLKFLLWWRGLTRSLNEGNWWVGGTGPC